MSFDALDISASALYAQRVRMDTISSNIANVNTTRNPDGTPGAYKRKQVVFSALYNDAVQSNGSSKSLNNGNDLPTNNSGSNMLLKGSVSFNEPNVANGVKVSEIVEDKNPYKKIYEPSHPDADKDGFVSMPNINIVTEMVDMMSASRAYEANATAIDASKNMIAAAMKI